MFEGLVTRHPIGEQHAQELAAWIAEEPRQTPTPRAFVRFDAGLGQIKQSPSKLEASGLELRQAERMPRDDAQYFSRAPRSGFTIEPFAHAPVWHSSRHPARRRPGAAFGSFAAGAAE